MNRAPPFSRNELTLGAPTSGILLIDGPVNRVRSDDVMLLRAQRFYNTTVVSSFAQSVRSRGSG